MLAIPASASARSWCAEPLYVHEWGVQAFDGSGARQSPATIPSWFHRAPGPTPGGAPGTPVRDLPIDSGERYLPILHFYVAGELHAPIPVGVSVGFTQGEASLWYPQVDARRSAALANTPQAAAERVALMQARNARRFGSPLTLGSPRDPTRQLTWDRLMLSTSPTHRAHRSAVPWVRALRAFDSLWVNGASESERFVFYEAQTSEQVALTITRGDTWAPDHRHLVLHNRGTHAVHDVFLTHREGRRRFVVSVPSIPAGRSASIVLEEHLTARRDFAASTRGALRARLVDSAAPEPPNERTWIAGGPQCVMGRNPAIPVDRSEGHRLYTHEVDAMLDVWGPTFFDARGTTITYREDTEYLDEVMPLSLHTEMHHFARLRRAGLAVWKNVPLP